MEVTTTQYNYCDLIQIKGRVDSYTAPRLSDAFNEIMALGRHKIILDLTEVSYVSSAGLRVLIDVQKACRRHAQSQLVLANVPPRVYETLELAGFVPLFKVFDQLESAIDHFRQIGSPEQ